MKKINENKLNQIIKEVISKILKENLDYEINDIYNGKMKDSDNPLLNKVWDNGFTLAEMLKSDDPMHRINYASSKLKYIGSGARRTTFILNDKYILKLANSENRYQTKNEYDSALLMTDRNDIFPRLVYQSNDFSWSIYERAYPLNDSTCYEILGIPLNSYNFSEPSLESFQLWAETKAKQYKNQEGLKNAIVRRGPDDSVYISLMKSHPFLKQLLNVERISRGNDLGTDLNDNGAFRRDNLGYVIRNGKKHIVILDAGTIKPFDTRKLKDKYGIESMQVPSDIKHT